MNLCRTPPSLKYVSEAPGVYPSNIFMPFAVNLERREIWFLLIIMKDREKDIQINDKSSVSVFVSLGPSNNAVFDKYP